MNEEIRFLEGEPGQTPNGPSPEPLVISDNAAPADEPQPLVISADTAGPAGEGEPLVILDGPPTEAERLAAAGVVPRTVIPFPPGAGQVLWGPYGPYVMTPWGPQPWAPQGWQPPTPQEPAEPEYQGVRRGLTAVAWVAIAVLVAGVISLPHLLDRGVENDQSAERIGNVVIQLQGRYIVGANQFQRNMGSPDSAMTEQAEQLNAGSIDQRLRALVLISELAGPETALRHLGHLQDRMEARNRKPTEQQSRIMRLLASIWRDREKDRPAVLAADDSMFLRRELGWFGELAMAPAEAPPAVRTAAMEPANRTMAAMISLVLFVIIAGVGGFVGLIVFTVLACKGKLKIGLTPGSPHAGIYTETFAVWMGVFFAGAIAAQYFAPPESQLAAGFASAMLSLGVLAWPVIRGIPWSQVRSDIGWTLGRKPWAEPFVGFGCWAMGLPMMLVGLVFMLILAGFQASFATPQIVDEFAPALPPTHPIVEFAAGGNWWMRLQIFLAACVAAPIVEETFFRGVLYRQLRTSTRRWPRFLGAASSALLSGVVFAAIHPQGWVAIPLLTALACGFCLAREWRDSLIPSITAHALNNGVVLSLFLFALN